MFQLINKNIEYEVDKKLINTSKHTKLGMVLDSLFWTLTFVTNLLQVFVCQLNWMYLKTYLPELEFAFVFKAAK